MHNTRLVASAMSCFDPPPLIALWHTSLMQVNKSMYDGRTETAKRCACSHVYGWCVSVYMCFSWAASWLIYTKC